MYVPKLYISKQFHRVLNGNTKYESQLNLGHPYANGYENTAKTILDSITNANTWTNFETIPVKSSADTFINYHIVANHHGKGAKKYMYFSFLVDVKKLNSFQRIVWNSQKLTISLQI